MRTVWEKRAISLKKKIIVKLTWRRIIVHASVGNQSMVIPKHPGILGSYIESEVSGYFSITFTILTNISLIPFATTKGKGADAPLTCWFLKLTLMKNIIYIGLS